LSFAYSAAARQWRDTPQSTPGSLPAPVAPRETGVTIALIPDPARIALPSQLPNPITPSPAG
jgi:hypothetical protein